MIDVVVVNYRTNGDLREFLESYEMSAPEEARLTVVDVDPITPYGYQKVRGSYIATTSNIGFNKACNMAAAKGVGDIIALFNADIVLEHRTIQACAQALRENETWGIIGPLQYDEKNRTTHAGIFGTHQAPKHRNWRGRVDETVRDVREAVSVSGSAYFIKRKVWDELTMCLYYRNVFPDAEGAFLPVQHYYGETGCSYHAWAHDYKVVYYGKANCVHKWHKASAVGTIERETMSADQALFRRFCDEHSIPRD